MAFSFEVRNERNETIAELWLGERDRSYKLAEGRSCPMPQAIAWCRDCETFVPAESIPSREEIECRLAELELAPEEFAKVKFSRYGSALVNMELERARWLVIRDWRRSRISPPRCLNCFSTELDRVVEVEGSVIHPVTEQTLTIHVTAHMSMAWQWEYTPEGLPLQPDEMG